jgi:hypothetical protein
VKILWAIRGDDIAIMISRGWSASARGFSVHLDRFWTLWEEYKYMKGIE